MLTSFTYVHIIRQISFEVKNYFLDHLKKCYGKIFLDFRAYLTYNSNMKKYIKEPWIESENILLLEYYHTLSKDALLAIFPGRSKAEIDMQAANLRRKDAKFKRN